MSSLEWRTFQTMYNFWRYYENIWIVQPGLYEIIWIDRKNLVNHFCCQNFNRFETYFIIIFNYFRKYSKDFKCFCDLECLLQVTLKVNNPNVTVDSLAWVTYKRFYFLEGQLEYFWCVLQWTVGFSEECGWHWTICVTATAVNFS